MSYAHLSRFVLSLVACLLTIAAAAGCEEKISADSYALLSPGMSLPDVEKVMGGKGTRQEVSGMSVSAAGVAGGSTTSSQEIWVWRAGRKEISVTIVAGKVVTTAKSGF
jgi:hypothetical protein